MTPRTPLLRPEHSPRQGSFVRLLLVVPLILAMVGLGGCNEQKLKKLEGRVASLEKDNRELKKRVAELEQLVRGGRSPVAKIPGLGGGLGGLAKMLQGFAAAGGMQVRTGRRPTMDPNLQKRMDKLVVDSLEKLANSKDAKDLVKSIIKSMRRDVDRKGGPGAKAGRGAEAPPKPTK